MVDQALGVEPVGHPGLAQQLDGRLLQHAGPDPPLHVVAAAGLEHHGVDAGPVQQMAEQETGRPGSDDADLGAHDR